MKANLLQQQSGVLLSPPITKHRAMRCPLATSSADTIKDINSSISISTDSGIEIVSTCYTGSKAIPG
ncbi:hypothetical protein TYRP_010912 [Tyrophagus putrescentiae]|nr:hypothetical protein TYRP_010912 [Tyrophagus putrescentiae]